MNTLEKSNMDVIKQQPEQEKPFIKQIILLSICLGYFMVILDTTIVNVALPAIQRELSTTVSGLQWIVEGYNLIFASFLLTAGALGDRLGSKRVFLWGLLAFVLASAACGVSLNIGMLQVMRVLQGCGAALLVPVSLSLLSNNFPQARERARAIGIWGSIGGIGAITGPVLGGFLVGTLGWRSIFWVNVPVGLLSVLLTWRFVAVPPRLQQKGLDLFAQCLGVLTLASLTFVLIEGSVLGWLSPFILCAAGVFIIAALAFILIERAAASPMLPLNLFNIPTFSASNLVGILLNLGFYGQLFVITFFFQQVRGYSPFITGLALLPETGLVMLASTISGRITGHVGPRIPMLTGLLVGSLGFAAMSFVRGETSYLVICVMLAAIGFGTAFTMPAMTAAVIGCAPRKRSGIAAAVLNASRQVGSVLGVAILGSFVHKGSAFLVGLHIAMIIAALAFLSGCVLSFIFVHRGHRWFNEQEEEKLSGAN